MITLPVHDAQGQKVGQTEIDEAAFGGEVRLRLMRQAVQMYECRQRVGTRGVRTRGEVEGSSRKLYRQKHTGRARMGTRRTCIRRGGGVAFHVKSGGYGYTIPKRARQAALRSALLSRFQDGEVIVLDSFALDSPRTREVARLLKNLHITGSCLWVTPEHDRTLWLSARNVDGLTMCTAADLNAHIVLQPDRLIIMKAALDRLTGAAS